jgi:sigma-E factor negative regulatory protein RseA
MHEDLNQKISQFLDNELSREEADSVLQKIRIQPELKSRWDRYEAISNAIKTSAYVHPRSDFLAKVNQQIQHEPVYLLPKNHLLVKAQPGMGMTVNVKLALAASLAVVAILVGQRINRAEAPIKLASPIQLAQQRINQPASRLVSGSYQSGQYPTNTRMIDYLQAHNNSVFTNGDIHIRPFAVVAAPSQE